MAAVRFGIQIPNLSSLAHGMPTHTVDLLIQDWVKCVVFTVKNDFTHNIPNSHRQITAQYHPLVGLSAFGLSYYMIFDLFH
jgi:hypothetical protein